MLKRLVVGLVLGVVLGAMAAAVLIRGFGMQEFASPLVAYLTAVLLGAVTGLVAGKPIWTQGGRIEAGLKAFFGALIAAGGMFAMRQWVHTTVDLEAFNAGAGELGALPAVSLPLVAAALAGFFELDNTDGNAEASGESSKKSGKAEDKKKVRVAEDETSDEEIEDEDEAPKKKKRRL